MIERTVLEISRHRFWAWRQRSAVSPRSQLRETDQLMNLVEECRIRKIPLIPAPAWRRIVQLLGQVDGDLTQRLGIDRSVEGTSEVLFRAQKALMQEQIVRRRQRPAPVVPLFRRGAN